MAQASHRVAIYIPSTMNGNEPAPDRVIDQWVMTAKMKFANLFGGFTAYRAVGGWVSPVHGLVEEPVTVVTSFTDNDGLGLVGEVEELAANLAEALGQEAVAVEVDNRLQFISPLCAAA